MIQILVFICGGIVVLLTISSALSTFVLPRADRSRLNRLIFGLMRYLFEFIMRFTRTYRQRDAIMAYYSPLSLIMLIPVWYVLIMLGYTAMYWSVGVGDLFTDFRFSGSSLLTLGFASSDQLIVNLLAFSEALLGLLMVALLMAYLPTMYAAFSRREQAVNMLEIRAGTPPNADDMLSRFHRIHGLDKLGDYWKVWEAWFADVEESPPRCRHWSSFGPRARIIHGSLLLGLCSTPLRYLYRLSISHMKHPLPCASVPVFSPCATWQIISIFPIPGTRIIQPRRSV